MRIEKILFGLLDTSEKVGDPRVLSKLRSITISWSRFGYRDLIIEAGNVNTILDRALELGYRYCLVQAYGHVIAETWYPKHWNRPDFQSSLRNWIENNDFFVTGHIINNGDGWFGLDSKCLLADLKYYEQFGRPAFDYPSVGPTELPKPLLTAKESADDSRISRLEPSDEFETAIPNISGWNFINVSLRNQKPVCNFNQEIADQEFCIDPNETALRLDTLPLPTGGEMSLRKNPEKLQGARNGAFLQDVARTLNNSKQGVFIWNIESYADVEELPPAFSPPVSRLYCVAAGFKPNRILSTHGFDEKTEILFFDYSLNALNVRKLIDQEWDGEDYPRFIKYILKRFPHPETFYHLWASLSPDELDWKDMDRLWQDEITKWGDEKAIKNHWVMYKQIKHDYIQCNILTEQQKLLEQIDASPNSVVWWSNAFFTIYSNWLYIIDEKKRFYDSWIAGLVEKNPYIFLYGSDYNNISINHVQAGEYFRYYSKYGGDYLNPYNLRRREIRF